MPNDCIFKNKKMLKNLRIDNKTNNNKSKKQIKRQTVKLEWVKMNDKLTRQILFISNNTRVT